MDWGKGGRAQVDLIPCHAGVALVCGGCGSGTLIVALLCFPRCVAEAFRLSSVLLSVPYHPQLPGEGATVLGLGTKRPTRQ